LVARQQRDELEEISAAIEPRGDAAGEPRLVQRVQIDVANQHCFFVGVGFRGDAVPREGEV
jgi:hypothetical protein